MLRSHCSDEELLRHLDGELRPWKAYCVSRHLHRCWKCRASLASIEAQLHEVSRRLEQDQFPRELRDAARERFFRAAAELPVPRRDAAPGGFLWRAWPARAAAGLVLSLSAYAGWHYVRDFGSAAPLRAPAAPPVPRRLPAVAFTTEPPRLAPHAAPAVPLHVPEPVRMGPDLGLVEMRARQILHRQRACMGEEIEIARDGPHELSVRGVVASRDRKRELAVALDDPGLYGAVRLDLRSVDELPARDAAGLPAQGGDADAWAGSAEMPIEPALLAQFRRENPSAGAEENRRRLVELSSKAVQLANLALSHAWALRRLAERYPAGTYEAMEEEGAASVRELARDHLAGLASAASELAALTRTPLAASAGRAPDGAPPLSPADSWQAAAQSLFRATERLFAHTNDLFARGGKPVSDLPARAAELKQILDGMTPGVSSAASLVMPATPAQARNAGDAR